MQIAIKKPKRGQTEQDRDNAVIDNHLLSCFDVGVYLRVRRALDEDTDIIFYIDDTDPDVLESLEKLREFEMIEFVG